MRNSKVIQTDIAQSRTCSVEFHTDRRIATGIPCGIGVTVGKGLISIYVFAPAFIIDLDFYRSLVRPPFTVDLLHVLAHPLNIGCPWWHIVHREMCRP